MFQRQVTQVQVILLAHITIQMEAIIREVYHFQMFLTAEEMSIREITKANPNQIVGLQQIVKTLEHLILQGQLVIAKMAILELLDYQMP